MLGAAGAKSSGAGAGNTIAIRAGSRSSPDSVRAALHRAALRSRQRVEHLLQVLDAVLSDLQRERRGPALEAPVAAADGAGGDEALALEAAIPLEMGASLRVAPVDHQRVAKARPARKIDGLAQSPVEPQLAVKAHRAGRALVGLADVDERVAAVGPQHGVARRIVVVRRPAEHERALAVPARGHDRGLPLDLRPGLARRPVIRVLRRAARARREPRGPERSGPPRKRATRARGAARRGRAPPRARAARRRAASSARDTDSPRLAASAAA